MVVHKPTRQINGGAKVFGCFNRYSIRIPMSFQLVLNLIFGYFGGGETPLHTPYPYKLIQV